jgi:transposase
MVHTMSKQDTRADRSRRVHSAAFKGELVARSLLPGASVSAVALAAGINANLLFKWRRMHLRAQRGALASPAHSAPVLLPVTIARSIAAASSATSSPRARAAMGGGSIDIEIAGARIRLHGPVDEAGLRHVLNALRERP